VSGRIALRACAAIQVEGVAIVPRFADEPLVAALAVEAHRRHAAGEFHAAGIGRGAKRAERPDIRGDRIAWLDEHALSPPEHALWTALDALRLALNRRAFLGLFSLEAHYAIYPPGAFYARHRDRFRDDDARVLSWALYLNERWTDADGGALRLHIDGQSAREVLPEGGTLVCFLSDRIEHEVLPTSRTRLSIAGWFRRRVSE
jgi:SM-20-related protein